jgi:TatA/E family protein of Tat protein translocase
MSYIPDIAFLTGSVGAGEWIMLFAVVLVVVGPRRLPEVARKFGRTMEMFRRAADEFKEQLMSMDQEINKNVSDASGSSDIEGVEGDEGVNDSYEPSYNYDEGAYDGSDYPGNEAIASEWSSKAESTALDSDGLTASGSDSVANVSLSEKPGEGDSASDAVADTSENPQSAGSTESDSAEEKS